MLVVCEIVFVVVQQSTWQRGTESDRWQLPASSTHQDEPEESSHVCRSFS